MSAISEADNNLCCYFKTQVPLAADGVCVCVCVCVCVWGGGGMMKVADVTGVAWQQMCVSSWQGSAASPVSGGGWTYSSCFMGLSLSVCLCFSDSLRRTADAFCTQSGISSKK